MSNAIRNTVFAMALSAAALVGLVQQEGYTDRAVVPVKGDVPTIGFGTTHGVKMGDTITPPMALVRALNDINQFESAIKQCVKVSLSQGEYDAYTSMTYNIGADAFCKSRLVKKLNSGDYENACKEILRWTYFQGKNCALPENTKLCGGLATRRQAEYKQCSGGR